MSKGHTFRFSRRNNSGVTSWLRHPTTSAAVECRPKVSRAVPFPPHHCFVFKMLAIALNFNSLSILFTYRNALPQIGKLNGIEECYYLDNTPIFHGHIPGIGVGIGFAVFGCSCSIP